MPVHNSNPNKNVAYIGPGTEIPGRNDVNGEGLRMAFFTVDVVAVFHKQSIFSGEMVEKMALVKLRFLSIGRLLPLVYRSRNSRFR